MKITIPHLALILLGLAGSANAAGGMTNLTISGVDFHINGQPTCAQAGGIDHRPEGRTAPAQPRVGN